MQELLQQEAGANLFQFSCFDALLQFSVYLASIARIQHTLSQEYEQLRIDNEQLRREIELKDEQLRVERDRLTQADDLLRAVLRECVFSSMPTVSILRIARALAPCSFRTGCCQTQELAASATRKSF